MYKAPNLRYNGLKIGDCKMDYAIIEVQITGTWQVQREVNNDSQTILMEMENVKRIYPDYRVRAVDKQGRLIDMMM